MSYTINNPLNNQPYASKLYVSDPEECEEFYEEHKKKWRKDPNNYIYDFETNTNKNPKKEYAEFNIWKRRQKTKNGSENPKTPCDDKGLPLFIDEDGNFTTKSNGNQIAWGEWINGSKEEVSTRNITVPTDCSSWDKTKIRGSYRNYPSSQAEVERVIERQEKTRQTTSKTEK